MRIAFFVDQFPCLSETFILNQITGLIDRGHDVHIYCDKLSKPTLVHPEVRQYRLEERTYYTPTRQNTWKTRLWRYVRGFWLLILNFHKAPLIIADSLNTVKYSQHRYGEFADWFKALFLMLPLLEQPAYDLIQCHYGRNGIKAILLKDLGVIEGKIVTAFHGHDLSSELVRYGDLIYDYLWQRGDLFLPISNYWADKLTALGCPTQRITVHQMGVEVTTAHQPTVSNSSQPDQITLVSVARLVAMKGLSYGIAAVAELVTQLPDLELQYWIVGDGVERSRLAQQIAQLGLTKQIKLWGWQEREQVQQILSQADIMLAPSIVTTMGDCEGIPVCLMEAMAQGIPIVSTAYSGIPELVADGVTGYLVPERDTNAITAKLAQLIENPDLRQKMGQAGRNKVLTDYNIELLNDRLVAIYQTLIEQ